ncbi:MULTISPECIES: Fe2+-dependent dioxygenase [unclassified Synechocystis]|uniref:Fe2+-dependent dioxygenase n=1 Tax=unclassified Synechocystis TaxID=2640012 RepID=UPI0004212BB8|nr:MULTISPECIES: Fe2+-dependent dioxygenase [unclassified Synechocystis]AIE75141.1 Iron-uptake factor PiuC [Synechocystis sp. PCC 6714]MCT0252904.1 Fe2+-dependent dioxygenase [Synechocystis sp. CS-94]
MIICIDRVLTKPQVTTIQQQLQTATFKEGRLTAGTFAQEVKDNEQAVIDLSLAALIDEIITPAIQNNTLFNAAIRPKKMRPCLLSRYLPGMAYGWHTDNALMGQGDHGSRSDVSLTLFLSDPESYGGGELVIDTGFGEQSFKLQAGSLVAYPATFLHRVTTVTAGERLAAVTWVESWVRSAQQREILFDLDTVQKSVFRKSGKTLEFDLLNKTYVNLLRQWME